MGSGAVIIFAGAGASAAVNNGKYPTTKQFYQKLPDTIRTNVIFKAVVEHLSAIHAENVDIEHVLWALYELNAFLGDAARAKTVVGHFLQNDRLTQTLGGNSTNLSGLWGNVPSWQHQLTNLSQEIDRIVHELYDELPTDEELSQTWVPLLQSFSPYCRVELFTTNYDRVIEQAIEGVNGSGFRRFDTGRRVNGISATLDVGMWHTPPDQRPVGGQGLLTKLHGSVDWSSGPDNTIYVGNPNYQGHDRQVITYPGYKGTAEGQPFAMFHDYLKEQLKTCAALVFIGYACRDSYINSVFRDSTPASAEIISINISEVATPFPERTRHYETGFSKETAVQLQAQLGFTSTAIPASAP